ncbi:MAG: hypothetical protein M0Q54_06195 [Pigmentiphaga sp.]|nr:hypothetical protein [Pigmentiphaga sp.]
MARKLPPLQSKDFVLRQGDNELFSEAARERNSCYDSSPLPSGSVPEVVCSGGERKGLRTSVLETFELKETQLA